MVQVETEQRHEAAQAIHDALGVRLFQRPPEGFNPLEAEDRELLVFGYPARPDKDRHPELHETWKRMVSRAAVRAADGQAARRPQHDRERHLDQLVRGGRVRREGRLGHLRHRAVDGSGRRRAGPG